MSPMEAGEGTDENGRDPSLGKDLWSRPRPVFAPTGSYALDPENVTSMRRCPGQKIFKKLWNQRDGAAFIGISGHFAPTAGHLRAPSQVLFLFENVRLFRITDKLELMKGESRVQALKFDGTMYPRKAALLK